MRVCFLHRTFPPNGGNIGGIVPYIIAMAEALRLAGHEVYIFTEATTATPVGLSHENGLTIFRMPKPTRLGDVPGEILHLCGIAKELRRFVIQHGIDVVETCDWGSETLFFARIKPKSVRIVLKLHCPLAVGNWVAGRKPRLRGRVYGWMERRCIQKADVVIAPTHYCADMSAKVLRLEGGRFRIVPNPIDTSRWTAATVPPRRRRILYTGRLEVGKGVDRLAPLLDGVLERYQDAEIRFVGSDAPYAPGQCSMSEHLRQCVSKTLHNRLQFVSPMAREELMAEYQQAYACWFPSRFESFSLVCAEAMACGTPVIGSQSTGMVEIVEHSKSGFLADFDDPDQVASYVKHLLASPILREEMSLAARQRIEAHFSLPVVARRWEEAVTGQASAASSEREHSDHARTALPTSRA